MSEHDYLKVATFDELRKLDDSKLAHLTPCLFTGLGNRWLLLDRKSTTADDGGLSSVSCRSNEGRWLVMTPLTKSIITRMLRARMAADQDEGGEGDMV